MEPSQMDPLKIAAQLGTLHAPDRSKQYRRTDNEELLRSLNELWKNSRLNEVAIRDRDKQLAAAHKQLKERDDLIDHQSRYLQSKDLKLWILRFALGLLITAQWGLIGWLATELLKRLH